MLYVLCKTCNAKIPKPWRQRQCRECRYAKSKAKNSQVVDGRSQRLSDEYATLKPEDFDVSVGNDGKIDPKATKEKRQEYSRQMGQFAQAIHLNAATNDPISEELDNYISKLSEQERRFGNRRIARSLSLAAAHERLHLRQFMIAAQHYLTDKIVATGYARKRYKKQMLNRTVTLLLSDLHLGAELSTLDNPIPFGAIQEARRLEFVVRQLLDFKPHYRNHTQANVIINGDIIQGLLLHDLRDGAPLVEQKVIAWRLLGQALALIAQNFPKVLVVYEPGNHGRDKARHPGRATSRKYDGHEWEIGYGLREMTRNLKNVTWQLGFRAVEIVDYYDQKLLVTHGDTEVKVGHPDRHIEKTRNVLHQINTRQLYGTPIHGAVFGHFHTGRFIPGSIPVLFNGALIPPDGYARTEGYIAEECGQWLWESVPGYLFGDLRFLHVDEKTDNDDTLGTLIKPFRFSESK